MKTSRSLRALGRPGAASPRHFIPTLPAFFFAILLVVAALWIGQPTPLVAQQSAMLTQAQKAFNTGDTATAKALFQQILANDPQNVTARNCLRIIEVQEKKVPAGALTEKKLAAIIIPTVEFKEATVKEALDYLSKSAEKVTTEAGAAYKPSFVLLPGVDPATKITLSLRNIPLTEVIRYIAQLTKSKVRIEPFAVTFALPTPEVEAPAPVQ